MKSTTTTAHDSYILKLMLAVSFGLAVLLAAMIARMPAQNQCPDTSVNHTYPLTAVESLSDGKRRYRLAVITDRDEQSAAGNNKWVAYMRYAYFTYDGGRVTIEWDKDTIELSSNLAQGGRSMELSDLKVFDGKLLTVDDRTGVVYRFLTPSKTVPWVLLEDGDGDVAKGFKAEWMTVKDDCLYVGGLGKEWTTPGGEFVNFNPMYVKRITAAGHVQHVPWIDEYKAVRSAVGIESPGYMIHEAVQWSEHMRRWLFLPRRASQFMYTEAEDEHRGTNYMITADEKFTDIAATKVTPLTATRGFSAFQFVPDTSDEVIVALKSEEDKGTINSYITVFTVHGQVLMEETKLDGQYKFEGVEFV